jgi:hypothetical protein
VFQFNNDNFVNAFDKVLKNMKEVDSWFPRLNCAVEQLGGQKTREFWHDPNVQLKCQGEWPVS